MDTVTTIVSSEDLARRAIERRAIEAINWGMPAVNLDLMLQAGISAGARPNQIDVLKSLGIEKGKPFTPDQKKQQIEWLGRALHERSRLVLELPGDPVFNRFRGHPRIDAIIAALPNGRACRTPPRPPSGR